MERLLTGGSSDCWMFGLDTLADTLDAERIGSPRTKVEGEVSV
jgi:hypothetical protein